MSTVKKLAVQISDQLDDIERSAKTVCSMSLAMAIAVEYCGEAEANPELLCPAMYELAGMASALLTRTTAAGSAAGDMLKAVEGGPAPAACPAPRAGES